jgi:hypothetical protein
MLVAPTFCAGSSSVKAALLRSRAQHYNYDYWLA